ncbi:MAG: ATP-binding protein, partial [Candidatus Aminicenantes bacterium]|nr:ATP-binding protein [Candidatus Aminicenantes bacterium]
ENGKVIGYQSAVLDVTEQRDAEKELKKHHDHLEQLVAERTALLEAANKELEAFSYSVSHDLRAPLRAIEGFSRIVLEEYAKKLDNEGRRLLDVIAANTHKMGQLIDDLLAFSRLSRQQIAFAPVDLALLAEAIFSELKSLEKERHIEFRVGALPAASGDHSMLQQVLQNLLANAVKFTRPRKLARLEFGGRTEKTENVYFVKDNGVGFDMEYVDKIFGVFQRLHGAEEFEGTGVGLAIVQRIISRHGGRVWAESKGGKGATFYFAIPNDKGLGSRG